jgi:hypothetical protein
VGPVDPDPDSDPQHWWKSISVSTWTRRPSTSAAPPFTTSEIKTPGPLFLPTILQTRQSLTLHSFYLRSVLDYSDYSEPSETKSFKLLLKTAKSVHVSSVILGEALFEASSPPGTAIKSRKFWHYFLFQFYVFAPLDIRIHKPAFMRNLRIH